MNGKGSASDLDIYFVDDDGNPITLCDDDPDALVCQFPGVDQNEGADAVEVPALVNDSEEDVHANIAIELFSGPAPRRMKYVWFDLGNGLLVVDEHDTQSGTLYGHANAAGAEAVGAAPWYNTAAFGPQNKPECAPACLELFSSAGGVPILFDRNGRRFPFPLIRIKPGLTGPMAATRRSSSRTSRRRFRLDRARRFPELLRHVRLGTARGRDRCTDDRSAHA